jgi:uncharacterized protein YdaU (DUF1376 family)
MKRGAPWYKRYSDDFYNGTRTLSIEARGAYNDILDLIYINDGPIPDDEKELGPALRISVRAWKKLRQELVVADKIYIRGGYISNSRADAELKNRRSQRRKNKIIASEREQKKREKNQNTNKINGTRARTVPRSVARNGHHAHARARSLDTEADKYSTREVRLVLGDRLVGGEYASDDGGVQ